MYSTSGPSTYEAQQRIIFKMDPRRDRIGQRPYHEVTGDNICPSMVRGIDFVRDPRLNKVST